MKIWKITFNDGGWYNGDRDRPSSMVVASTKAEAISIAKLKQENKHYKNCDCWVSEFKIDGYVIEAYDEKTYNRDKNLSKLEV